MNEQASAWLNSVEGLADVHERLKRVVVLCDDALKVIRQQDGERTLYLARIREKYSDLVRINDQSYIIKAIFHHLF